MTSSLVDRAMAFAPLWVLGVALFLLLMLMSRLGMRFRTRSGGDDGRTDDEGYLLSATLALLGLLIAFTFSLALNRYDARGALVVSEANAISTAWLRAGLIEGEAGKALQASIARYTDIRLALPTTVSDRAADQVEQSTMRAQAMLWRQMADAIRDAHSPVTATIVTATTEMFDAAASRKAERAARIPWRVIEVLLLYAAMSAAIVGYVLGRAGARHRLITSALFLLLTLAIVLILDLDRPWSGAIVVPQQPMIDARVAMN